MCDRFFKDCPIETQQFNVSNDPIETCNHFIKSEPEELDEAYWKIRGVYVFERELEDYLILNKTPVTTLMPRDLPPNPRST